VLANWGGYYGQSVYLTEARRMGLPVRPPHINHSARQFSAVPLEGQLHLFMGLDQVKELSARTIHRIRSERPFSSLEDFLDRADPRPAEADHLVKCCALDGFGAIPDLLERLKGRGARRGQAARGQMALFPLDDHSSTGQDWSLAETVNAQREILGVGVSAHPLELAGNRISAARALTTVEAAARLGEKVRLAGMRQTWQRSRDRSSQVVYYLSLEDLEGMLEVQISASVYQRCRSALSGAGPYLVEGEVAFDETHGEPYVRAERIEKL
jgi:DNA polymerase III alpha subunit